MTAGGVVNVSGQLYGISPSGAFTIGPFQISSTLDDIQSELRTFFVGNTTVTIPNWATAVIIVPAPGNTGTMLVCQQVIGFGDDQGIAISEQYPSMFSLAEASNSYFTIACPNEPAVAQLIFF